MVDAAADTVAGTIHAPWLAGETLQGHAGGWGYPGWESFSTSLDTVGVGTYFVDFSPTDLHPGSWLEVNYREPDGDEVKGSASAPGLTMEVNYRDERVKGSCEAGHTVWITVTENDDVTAKATAVVTTDQSGFQTWGDDWSPSQPDIVPGDWVHGLVDNGYTGTVQIGTITGYANAASDSIAGTIAAAWITQEVDVTCYPWGAPGGAPNKHDTVFPDGVDVYSCSWDPATEWDVQPNQDIGVWYREPDGDEVFNVFRAPWRVFLPLVLCNYQ